MGLPFLFTREHTHKSTQVNLNLDYYPSHTVLHPYSAAYLLYFFLSHAFLSSTHWLSLLTPLTPSLTLLCILFFLSPTLTLSHSPTQSITHSFISFFLSPTHSLSLSLPHCLRHSPSTASSPYFLDEWGCSASSPWLLHPAHSTQVGLFTLLYFTLLCFTLLCFALLFHAVESAGSFCHNAL